MTTRLADHRRRPAFTLVELIVVISIIAFLAGLAILIIPNLNDQQRAPRGAFSLQQWLLTAKNRAMRDAQARGVRLSFTGTQNVKTGAITYDAVTGAQYIEQPDDYIVLPGVAADPFNPAGGVLPFRRIHSYVDPSTGTPNPARVVLEAGPAGAADFSGGFGDANRSLWPVQPGDYLEINGGLPHRIDSLPDALTLVLALPTTPPTPSPLPAVIPRANPVASYRILRGPRVAGDEQLQLPDEIGIDLNTNAKYGLPLPTVLTSVTPINATTNRVAGTIDILFSPQGAVVGRGTAGDALYLWVRDLTLKLFEGDNTLVVVYTRTGAVAAYPVNNTQGPGQDPYSFAKSGRASGL